MDQRIEITKFVIEKLNLSSDEKFFKRCYQLWWQNPRKKSQGGMRLTAQGYEFLKKAEIKDYRIDLIDNVNWNARLVIDLDNLIDCPFFITNKSVFVFCERMAVQLVLFSGNIAKFGWAKKQQSKSSIKIN